MKLLCIKGGTVGVSVGRLKVVKNRVYTVSNEEGTEVLLKYPKHFVQETHMDSSLVGADGIFYTNKR